MTPKEVKNAIKEGTRIDLARQGIEMDPKVFNLAYAKAKRWAAGAYGAADMYEFLQEGGSIAYWYKESLEGVQGTFNRQTYQNRGEQ